ncbi:MAG: N-acetylglucosamine-6-phosphate deacetylase [Albidovulum sp.]
MITLFQGADIFDGRSLMPGSLLIDDGLVSAIVAPGTQVQASNTVTLNGGILAPGFVDLQVNGGGGVMLNDRPAVETLATMAKAHARLGTLTFLPTLITDSADHIRNAVDAVEKAVAMKMPGVAGLHLEGPHLSLARKGAHDATLIRDMSDNDVNFLVVAAKRLPCLMVTLAPESVRPDQISRLCGAGIIVSLGHSDASFETCMAAFAAGATMTTHLFNAMSPFGSRDPGLVGASLHNGGCSAGLIADGIHVHPVAISAALRAKNGPGQIFLVTDAMACAGTVLSEFALNGRTIRRVAGRLVLADGTLAGADLDMAQAVRVMVRDVGISVDRALAMATSVPARIPGCAESCGGLVAGGRADFLHLSNDLHLLSVWSGGEAVPVM